MSGSLLASAGVSVIQLGAAVTGGPLLYGLMAQVRARAEGRAGAPVRQPLLDLWKLAGKERIHAEHSSAVLPLASAGAITAAVPGRRWAGWAATAANGAVLVLGIMLAVQVTRGHPAGAAGGILRADALSAFMVIVNRCRKPPR